MPVVDRSFIRSFSPIPVMDCLATSLSIGTGADHSPDGYPEVECAISHPAKFARGLKAACSCASLDDDGPSPPMHHARPPNPQDEFDQALRSVESAQVALVAENAHRSLPITSAAAAMIATVAAVHVPLHWPALWWIAVTVALILRNRVLDWLARRSSWSDRAKLDGVVWAFLLTACAQSSLMLMAPMVSVSVVAMFTIYLGGMAAALVASSAGSARVVTVYSGIALGTIALTWALVPKDGIARVDQVVIALLMAGYLFALRAYAHRAHGVFVESYRIRLERIALNAQLREALGEAEMANRAKTRFLASASHDLRQPIHALSLFSGSLLMRPLDARSTGIARQIDRAVQTLGSQLDALLDISRLDAGVVQAKLQGVDLAVLFDQIRSQFAAQAQAKGLIFGAEGRHLPCVHSDSALLTRVLGNLVSNAIKYTAHGRVDLTAESDAHRCTIVVRDTGSGIPEAERDRVFEEFYQLDNPERDREKGLGLGLSIVRRLCVLLNVPLRLQSVDGEGCEFSIELPLASAMEIPMPEKEKDVTAGAAMRVLVIDDEEQVRIGMQTLLEEMGFKVSVASSTEAAMEDSVQFQPEVVLADFRLRGTDNGIRAIRALRQRWPRLPALLISGDTAPERLREARESGLELLHKPLRPTELRESILRVVA